MDLTKIIIRPVITEKGSLLRERNCYIFEVDYKANKSEIKKAISELFKVDVIAVNTLRQKGKEKKSARGIYRRKNSKKAMVFVAPNQKLFE